MATRSKARELALQMLFQQDLNPDIEAAIVREMIDERLRNPDLQSFAWSLFSGVIEIREELDQLLETTAENWTIVRMAPTDRNVLRLATFELLHTITPHRVVIDEAIELAKRFGSKQSPQFVNGILDRLIPDEKRD